MDHSEKEDLSLSLPSPSLSQMHSELVRKQLENDNLQHTLDFEKTQLDQQKKVHAHTTAKTTIPNTHTHSLSLFLQKLEGAMKTGQTELHALQKQQRALQQRLEGGPRKKRELEAAREQ